MLTQMFPNVVYCFSLFVANKLMNTETVSYPSIFQNGDQGTLCRQRKRRKDIQDTTLEARS